MIGWFLGGVATGITLSMIVLMALWVWLTRPLRSMTDSDEPYVGFEP